MSVQIETSGDLAIVTIDNPPVNALSQPIRAGLLHAATSLDDDPAVRAVILTCAGRGFIAGADIREFGKPPVAPHLPDVVRALARTSKPWVAAIHGSALGGGLEVAMACDFRVAAPDAKLGLPEVTIGAVPGAGGTVMLPRLVPAMTALEMIATGKPLSAVAALEAGLVDDIAQGDLVRGAQTLLRERAGNHRLPPIFARSVNAVADESAFDAAARRIEERARGQNSPAEAIRLLRHALDAPAEAALVEERATFLRLREDPQARALRHIFLAERAAGKIGRLAGVTAGPLDHVGVVGGGTMGAGIAAACLLSGLSVTMIERDDAAMAAGSRRVHQILEGARDRGLLDARKHAALLDSFSAGTEYAALAPADLVVEAVFEDMALKQEVFSRLEQATQPQAVLASNTSYLDLNEIARHCADPSRVIGLHFFSPAHVMKLLEIVVPDRVSDRVLATGTALARKLGKIPVHAGVCDGFIANRIMSAYRRDCDIMLEDGALPWDIDAAMTAFGLPMGIYRMQDLAGLDISWAMRKRQAAARDPSERYVDIADRLCEMGRFGQKTGRGWYLHEGGRALPCPEVEALILSESRRKGISRRSFSGDEIIARILAAMQEEGRRILTEGIAQSADDIDAVMVNAYGFPRWRGGPMFLASEAGRTP